MLFNLFVIWLNCERGPVTYQHCGNWTFVLVLTDTDPDDHQANLLVIMHVTLIFTRRIPSLCLLTSFDFGRAYMKQRCRWSLVLYVRLDVYAKLITQPSTVTPKMDGKLVNFIWKLQLNAATWSDQFHFFTCITGRNLSNMTTPFLMEDGFYYMQFKLKEGFDFNFCSVHFPDLSSVHFLVTIL